MLDSSQAWNLFGYDVSQLVTTFKTGWYEFLWGEGSAVREALDEPVSLLDSAGNGNCYRVGLPVDNQNTRSQAVLLPDNLVLARVLKLPAAAEGNLAVVVALEAKASSPFPEDDTCFGWSIRQRRTGTLDVLLVICARSSVMEYLASHHDTHDTHACEVWAEIDGTMQVIAGFGESARQQRYRRRLLRAGGGLAYCLVALVLCFAIATGMKYLDMQRVEAAYDEVRLRAARAVELREALNLGNSRVKAANKMLAERPDFYRELMRLSALLDDETWITLVDIKNGTMRINGQSPNAAAVMQKLTDESAYDEVTAPSAIRKARRSDLENFVLEITFAAKVSG